MTLLFQAAGINSEPWRISHSCLLGLLFLSLFLKRCVLNVRSLWKNPWHDFSRVPPQVLRETVLLQSCKTDRGLSWNCDFLYKLALGPNEEGGTSRNKQCLCQFHASHLYYLEAAEDDFMLPPLACPLTAQRLDLQVDKIKGGSHPASFSHLQPHKAGRYTTDLFRWYPSRSWQSIALSYVYKRSLQSF